MSEQQQQSGNKGEINSSKTRGSTTGKRPATVTKKASPGRTRSGKRYGSAGSTKTTVTAKQDKGKMKGNGGGDEEPMESEPSSTASRSTATMSNSSQQLLFHSFSTNNEQGDEEGTNEVFNVDK
jgi:hypothetical protein